MYTQVDVCVSTGCYGLSDSTGQWYQIFLHKSSTKLHIPELRTTLAVKKRRTRNMHKMYGKTNESMKNMKDKGGGGGLRRRPPFIVHKSH